jgi:hypothetical protein
MRAVLDVFKENQAREAASIKASADTWGLHSARRHELVERVSAKWCRICGKDSSWFPYSEDAIVKAYFSFRKRNAAEIEAFHREIEAARDRAPAPSLFPEAVP